MNESNLGFWLLFVTLVTLSSGIFCAYLKKPPLYSFIVSIFVYSFVFMVGLYSVWDLLYYGSDEPRRSTLIELFVYIVETYIVLFIPFAAINAVAYFVTDLRFKKLTKK